MSSTTSITSREVTRQIRKLDKLIMNGNKPTSDQLDERYRRLEAYTAYSELFDEFERVLTGIRNDKLWRQELWDLHGSSHRVARTRWYQLVMPRRDLLELGRVQVASLGNDNMPLVHFITSYVLYFDEEGELLVYPELIAGDEYGTGAKITPLIDVAESGTAGHFRMILAFLQNLQPFA